ncbi:28061_t:CDS:2 [Dentiscutata erythropus]|uniref:28061_t:CDS:1 n=1 Tax=Dentiscutata erythropus TaxID=1348616 RepID=A0A9N9DAU0_9GLOM|nr:28061_t:CDS:2 [Dentiscutata erythropus]
MEFKKEVEILQLSPNKESIIKAMKSIESISTTARAESSHSAFKQAIETASGLESVFENIDQRMQVKNLKIAVYTGTNKVACNPFTLRDSRFSIIIGNVSTYAINRIKNLLVEIQENSTKYKGPIPLNIIDKCWYLYRSKIKDLPSPSLELSATNPKFYKVFLKAENTFCELPNDTSINAKFIASPKMKVSKGCHSGTKHKKLLSEKQDIETKKKKKVLHNLLSKINQANTLQSPIISYKDVDMYEDSMPMFMKKFILSYINVRSDGNCGFRAIAISLEISEDEWPTI